MTIFFGRLAATLAVVTVALFFAAYAFVGPNQPHPLIAVLLLSAIATGASLFLCIISGIWEYEWWKKLN